MRILGIDPGLKTIGLGLIESDNGGRNLSVIEWLTIETMTGLPFAERLAEIARDIDQYLQEQKPNLAVVEKLYFQTNRQTAMDVAQARGTLITALGLHGIETLEPTPLELKSTVTGDGRADKRQMQDMVKRLLNLKEIPKPDDAADALALAVYGSCHAATLHGVI